jgi:hypothetical protein
VDQAVSHAASFASEGKIGDGARPAVAYAAQVTFRLSHGASTASRRIAKQLEFRFPIDRQSEPICRPADERRVFLLGHGLIANGFE